jgi:hypothetical protein
MLWRHFCFTFDRWKLKSFEINYNWTDFGFIDKVAMRIKSHLESLLLCFLRCVYASNFTL